MDCRGNMYAVTGSNTGSAVPFALAQSVVRVNKATGAGIVVCTFPSTERVQVGAFISSDSNGTMAYFSGEASPIMQLLTLSLQSGRDCVVRYVQ